MKVTTTAAGHWKYSQTTARMERMKLKTPRTNSRMVTRRLARMCWIVVCSSPAEHRSA
jgi:hypothetical protein